MSVLLFLLLNSMYSSSQEVGFEEKLGNSIPADVYLADENGKDVRLGDYIDRPVVLNFVFFGCHGICDTLMASVASLLDKMELTPGKDFRVLTISFDEKDNPSHAKEKKTLFSGTMKKKIDEDGWKFLTGNPESIKTITQ